MEFTGLEYYKTEKGASLAESKGAKASRYSWQAPDFGLE